jgi:hypothetical protein
MHFFISVSLRLKCCPSLVDATGIRVLPRNFRNSFLFAATCNNSPSARCVSAAKRVCKDARIFRKYVTYFKKYFAPLCGSFILYQLIYVFFLGFRVLPQYFFWVAFFMSHLFCFVCLVICFCVFVLFL